MTKPQKELKKTKDEVMKQVKESILIDEIANKDIENKRKTSKVRWRRWKL